MSRLLVKAAHTVNNAVRSGQSVLAERLRRRFEALYDAIIKEGFAFHEAQPRLGRKPKARGRAPKRPGHNLLVRLRTYRSDVLRFMSDFAVPFSRVDGWRGDLRWRGLSVVRRLSPVPVSQFAP